MPLPLFVSNTDSLGAQIQRAFPAVKVVKTLNTMTAFAIADPSLVTGGDHSVFLCADDEEAKVQVTEILRSFGWRDVIDLGDITSARGMESYYRYGSACGSAAGADVQHQGRAMTELVQPQLSPVVSHSSWRQRGGSAAGSG